MRKVSILIGIVVALAALAWLANRSVVPRELSQAQSTKAAQPAREAPKAVVRRKSQPSAALVEMVRNPRTRNRLYESDEDNAGSWPEGVSRQVFGAQGVADAFARALDNPQARGVALDVDCSEFPCLVSYSGEELTWAEIGTIRDDMATHIGARVVLQGMPYVLMNSDGEREHYFFASLYPEAVQTPELDAHAGHRINDGIASVWPAGVELPARLR